MSRPEDERVKIPALLHLTRLGYQYVSLKENAYDGDTDIFVDVFRDAVCRLNDYSFSDAEINTMLQDFKQVLDTEDLGKQFYNYLLKGYNGVTLIDFNHPERNTWQIATELPCVNGQDEFRPDITILINGIPLAFIEVKRPNNKDGIQAEYDRMNRRVQNRKFRRFINMTQLMVFSNNGEYDDNEAVPLEGAYYATIGYEKLFFSHFREEDDSIFTRVAPLDETIESKILTDTNLVTIKSAPDYQTNTSPMTPTHRMLTSLFSKDRLLFLLRYGLAYVERTDDNGIKHLEKHVMRYPQIFATKAIEEKLNHNDKHGVIWHTQGSGKTALAYFNVRYLTDYYQKQGIIAKFYFIVDRLDLLKQAADEFRARGLHVDTVESKEDFTKAIGQTGEANASGELSITVVNIQKFSTDSISRPSDYNVNVQRVYFMDEAHRSYNPKGSFLSNLLSSDREAVMIALTGTPLIGDGYNTKDVFGAYIHKYYYNRSIKDGYTLRLIREGIRTEYRTQLQGILESIKALKGSIDRKDLYAHPAYVRDLVKYIVEDFRRSRIALGDSSIGGMIVCDSSEKAREVFHQLEDYDLTAALILHDQEDKETREKKVDHFKKGTIDLLVVYNMLLTGFDAPRLKKLYLGRVIKDHSLLQALTRVNRPYKKHRYGFVVDFADIRAEFDKTNKAYFDELQAELGDAFHQYDSIFMTPEEITAALQEIQQKLFLYDTENVSLFTQQISAIEDKEELLSLRKALESYKELQNIARLFGYEELADKFTLENANKLSNEVQNRIALVNTKNALNDPQDMTAVLNLAMSEIQFVFKRVSKDEMVIADAFRDALDKTHREMQHTFDPQDPEYITLLEELQRLFQKKHIEELTADEMKEHMQELERIRSRAAALNQRDALLTHKYADDPKFMRIHKRLMSNPPPIGTDAQIFPVLMDLMRLADSRVLANQRMLQNEPYFTAEMMPAIKQALQAHGLPFTLPQLKFVGATLSQEYFHERTWAQ